ncbi:MAG: ABC transporter ATP-binding protein [Holosporaceae bacterium]|jgi:lipoprotein-releasing system ATP-binding protein|nr:ABC transporter ATP-binding protein [Rhodospirillaceae bacterium]
MTTVLDLKHVSRVLTNEAVPVTLLHDINLTIDHGEFVAIVGPSGSGKSSLMYLLGLLDQPSAGDIILHGVNTTNAPESVLERLRLEKIGFVFQYHFLLPEFSALDNIMLPMRKLRALSHSQMRQRAEELLCYFGLEKAGHRLPGQLSGGERQRVAIARAMANDPLFLMADEPSGNLDTKNADLVFSLFERLAKEQNKTVITITHDPALAARAHRQINLVDGQLVTA